MQFSRSRIISSPLEDRLTVEIIAVPRSSTFIIDVTGSYYGLGRLSHAAAAAAISLPESQGLLEELHSIAADEGLLRDGKLLLAREGIWVDKNDRAAKPLNDLLSRP